MSPSLVAEPICLKWYILEKLVFWSNSLLLSYLVSFHIFLFITYLFLFSSFLKTLNCLLQQFFFFNIPLKKRVKNVGWRSKGWIQRTQIVMQRGIKYTIILLFLTMLEPSGTPRGETINDRPLSVTEEYSIPLGTLKMKVQIKLINVGSY